MKAPGNSFEPFESKMREAGLSSTAIRAFEANLRRSVEEPAMLPESAIEPVKSDAFPRFEDFKHADFTSSLLSQTVVLKLNGGLGTTMGLKGAKSLLKIKDSHTFLDLIVRQILRLRQVYRDHVRLVFMNSFSTSAEVTAHLEKNYPELAAEPDIELVQNKVPKIDAAADRPASYPPNPALEWCPPGHGDLYLCIWENGALDRWIKAGVRYLFISNADNIGATLDPRLVHYFSEANHSFLMEVAERTELDQKGGHLARRISDHKFILRESAQCPRDGLKSFQDIRRHRYFNTNNLWIKLAPLARLLKETDGILPLPVIRNLKRVDPADPKSPEVYQLETAVGSAIQCFESAGAVVVPRTRFLPVKTHEDLERLRSDSYRLTAEFTLAPATR